MRIFIIDFAKLTTQLLPAKLRRKRFRAWLRVMVAPIVSLHGRLLAFREEVLYELSHNGQVCRLEGLLNDRFDPEERRIYIEDAAKILPLNIFSRAENKPVYIRSRAEAFPRYLRKRSELTRGGAFVVKVPTVVVFDGPEMISLINKYKLAGKGYTVKTFTL